MVDTLNI